MIDSVNNGLIDFTEIREPESFEELVAELMQRQDRVVNVESTGRGGDFEADLIVTINDVAPLTATTKTRRAIVQCKHFAKSRRSVTKKDIRPLEALRHYEADIYVLVTSSTVGHFYAQLIKDIRDDKKNKGEDATSWDHLQLEYHLTLEKNEDLLLKYFPRSHKRVSRFKQSFHKAVQTSTNKVKDHLRDILPVKPDEDSSINSKDSIMQKAYFIHSAHDLKILEQSTLREKAKRNLRIDIETSTDISNDSFWSIERSTILEKEIRSVDAAFAMVTKQGAKAPNVWLEIAEARMSGKLKVVFVDESVYTLSLLGKYPCVLLRKQFSKSASDLENFYRTVKQSWGDGADQWFWFSLSVLATYHNTRTSLSGHKPKKVHYE